jgi:hypothetical protein
MEIDPVNCAMFLIEADVIESLETSTVERAYSVIRDQKFLLPPHEYIVTLRPAGNLDIHFPRVLLVGTESREFGPVLVIYKLCRAPILMLGEKSVFRANQLPFKVGCEGRMVWGQACVQRNRISAYAYNISYLARCITLDS